MWIVCNNIFVIVIVWEAMYSPPSVNLSLPVLWQYSSSTLTFYFSPLSSSPFSLLYCPSYPSSSPSQIPFPSSPLSLFSPPFLSPFITFSSSSFFVYFLPFCPYHSFQFPSLLLLHPILLLPLALLPASSFPPSSSPFVTHYPCGKSINLGKIGCIFTHF